MTSRIISVMAAIALGCGLCDAASAASALISRPFSGITLEKRVQSRPRHLIIDLLTIDLNNPNIRFLVTPPDGGKAPGLQTTPDFVAQVKAQAGVNANLFSWKPALVSGIAASEGTTYGTFNPGRPTMNLSADHVATFLSSVPADFSFYNAISGSDRIVRNGVNTADPKTGAEATNNKARSAVGLTADNKLLLMTIDGGGGSGGVKTSEEADLMIACGAVEALNLDGGGSATMVLRQSAAPRVLNHPTDGKPRKVRVNLAVFAAPAARQKNLLVYDDFYGGDQGTFSIAPTHSGNSKGILDSSTNKAVQGADAGTDGWFDRLSIRDDPNVAGAPDRAGSGWFVRLSSGSHADPSEIVSRPTTGRIGYWARTSTPGVLGGIALDNPDGSSAGRGVLRPLIADGQWHLYQWDLQDSAQWEPWLGAKGFNGKTFTLDSLQFYGPNRDATIDIDTISHNALGPLKDRR